MFNFRRVRVGNDVLFLNPGNEREEVSFLLRAVGCCRKLNKGMRSVLRMPGLFLNLVRQLEFDGNLRLNLDRFAIQ
jgi:hypothetical protein